MKKLFVYLCCLFLYTNIQAQLDCEAVGGYVFCQTSQTLNVYPGEDITNKLRNAINSGCEVRIPNNGQLAVTYYLYPMVFSGDGTNQNTAVINTRIILEQGVTLQSYFGASSNCSQSIFTFDGTANRYIEIIGEYTTCDTRPVIRMPQVNYTQDATTGFLVASDGVGEPYLNNAGDPNFVFDDGDSDPYFDNFGNPNLITNNEPPVPADCDYNFNLCNRKIIVWCPDNWEGNHIIAAHGIQNMTVKGVSLESAAGGDGIVLARADDGTPCSDILIEDVHFINNARTGIDVQSAACIKIFGTYINLTGTQNGLAPYVDVRGGVALQANPNGNDQEYFMHSIEFKNSTILDNKVAGVTLDFPSLLNPIYAPSLLVDIDQVCVSGTSTGLLLNNSPNNLAGYVSLRNMSFNNADFGVDVSANWLSQATTVDVFNLDISSATLGQDIVIGNPAVFCGNLVAADICFGTTTNICGLAISCNPGNNGICASTPVECSNPGCDFPIVDLTNDGPMDCDNPFVTISTNSTGYCYEWSHDPDLTDPSIQVSAPGTYCVTVTDCVTGCAITECTTVEDASCGDCGDKGCTCELTITLEDIGSNPFQVVGFGAPQTQGPITSFPGAGTYSVTVGSTKDCNPIVYGFALGGNSTNVEVLITVTGCGVNEQITLTSGTGIAPFEVNEPCLPPPPNPGCLATGSGSALTWDPVVGATGYIITVVETNCDADCSPIFPTPTPIVINVAGGSNTTYVATTPPLPQCYTWAVQTVSSNGGISDCSESVCQNGDTICEDPCFDPAACPDPCPDLDRPNPECDSAEGSSSVSWPAVPYATGYIVTLSYGPSECCPEATASATFVYQVIGNTLDLPEGYGQCFTITVEAYCDDFTTSGPSQTLCFDRGVCGEKEDNGGDGKKRNEDGYFENVSTTSSFELYPNPARDLVNITFNAKAAASLNMTVISSDGRILQSKLVDLTAGSNALQLATDNLPSGIYFLLMESNQEKFYQKFSIID